MTVKRIALIAATIVTGLMAAMALVDAALTPPFARPVVPATMAMILWLVLFGHLLHRVLTGRWRWWRSTRG